MSEPVDVISEIILNDVRQHANGAVQSDDITLMIIKREPQ